MPSEQSLDALPESVKKQLGDAELALEFDIEQRESLPNAEKSVVLEKLESQGFYIQMPRDIEALLAGVGNDTTKKQLE